MAKLFETGGSNSHLKLLIRYFGAENVILVLANQEQKAYIDAVTSSQQLHVKILEGLLPYAHLRYRFTTNVKEFLKIIISIIRVTLLSIRYNADITICAVEPEKYLYMLWLPFIRLNYILHTIPTHLLTPITAKICDTRLGKKKRIIAVSDFMKKSVCDKWLVKPSKQQFITTIHNTLAIEAPVADHQYAGKSKTILTVGSVDENKNPWTWLAVAEAIVAEHKDTQFTWIGNGPLLDDLTKATIATPRISFKGLIKNPQPYFEDAWLYYQPSHAESHGIAVLEAMSNALPCVVSKTGGMPESVLDGYNGHLVNAADEDAHVQAIAKLINDPDLAALYGANSYQRFNKLFSYDAFKDKMDRVYGTVQ